MKKIVLNNWTIRNDIFSNINKEVRVNISVNSTAKLGETIREIIHFNISIPFGESNAHIQNQLRYVRHT